MVLTLMLSDVPIDNVKAGLLRDANKASVVHAHQAATPGLLAELSKWAAGSPLAHTLPISSVGGRMQQLTKSDADGTSTPADRLQLRELRAVTCDGAVPVWLGLGDEAVTAACNIVKAKLENTSSSGSSGGSTPLPAAASNDSPVPDRSDLLVSWSVSSAWYRPRVGASTVPP